MKPTEPYRKGIIEILNTIKLIIPDIGTYIEHAQNSNKLTVKLTNGTLSIPIEIVHDQQEQKRLISNHEYFLISRTFKEL